MRQGTFASRAVTTLMALAAVAGTTAIVAPAADAAANRRVCVYSRADTTSNGRVFQWAMNWKKADGCPHNNNRASLQSTAEAVAFTKVTCEEYAKWVRVTFDPCPNHMPSSQLIYVEWSDNGKKPTTFSARGHY